VEGDAVDSVKSIVDVDTFVGLETFVSVEDVVGMVTMLAKFTGVEGAVWEGKVLRASASQVFDELVLISVTRSGNDYKDCHYSYEVDLLGLHLLGKNSCVQKLEASSLLEFMYIVTIHEHPNNCESIVSITYISRSHQDGTRNLIFGSPFITYPTTVPIHHQTSQSPIIPVFEALASEVAAKPHGSLFANSSNLPNIYFAHVKSLIEWYHDDSIVDEYQDLITSPLLHSRSYSLVVQTTRTEAVPKISTIGLDILSISAMSATPERLFSDTQITIIDLPSTLGFAAAYVLKELVQDPGYGGSSVEFGRQDMRLESHRGK
jgi:hypothetical protein